MIPKRNKSGEKLLKAAAVRIAFMAWPEAPSSTSAEKRPAVTPACTLRKTRLAPCPILIPDYWPTAITIID